ncbi:MAG: tRNA pseudouridine(38-40) synthase TruA [Candidatus Korobacteraceae bacterium]
MSSESALLSRVYQQGGACGMRNLKFTLAYDGSEFYGWQVQPELPTVQAALAAAIVRVTGETVLPQGSGRTDAGVHALAQVASLSLKSEIPSANLQVALNDALPASIRVTHVTEVESAFHARKSAQGKTYCYRIYRGQVCPPFLARYVFHYPYPLNEEAMMAASREVEGEHDFTSFAAVDAEDHGRIGRASVAFEMERSNVRRIFESSWERIVEDNKSSTCTASGATNGESAYELVYTVRGSGFLHHMVRNLVGCFLLIGRNRLTRADIPRILEERSRSQNPGATAPGHGLYLVSVDY